MRTNVRKLKTVGLKFNAYEILSRCVESGLLGGYNRAHKYEAKPGEDALLEQQYNYIMNAITEVLDYEN